MSTDGISLNIVQNSTSDKLSKGDLKKAWGRLERRWNPKTREDKVLLYTKFLNYKLENVKQRPMDWLAFMEKKRNELTNTGHIMDDETFITHLLNSLPQVEYEGVILVVKERLRSRSCDVAEVEQLLEDKYLSMKCVKGWEEEEDDYALFASPAKKKGPKNSLKDDVATVERLDTNQRIVLTRKARKKRTPITEVCQLLEVSWQMCHAWIAHWTVARATLTMSRRRSMHGERTQGRKRARTFFGAHVSPFGASSARIRIVARVTSARIKEPSMASELHTKSSIPNTYQ